ncbi:MAG: nicotinate (nicotinamide) nucleotide adenylyltransferase [Eubacterium sp.]|nr:nicotinate (nicotinamide) nucleotide adenylyltransferase [Eubacterium sp.]
MKIGIFGGAFNPVHNGHLTLIDVLSRVPMHPDFRNLDKFIIVPTADPPHRSGADFASGIDRVNMLRLALKNNDIFEKNVSYKRLEISDIEFSMVGKSYTYNTLKALKALYPEDEFYLFMGSDQLFTFREWYKYKNILKMARLVGFARSNGDNSKIKQFLIENKDLGADAVYYSPIEVSSSAIREKLKNGESIENLVPKAVENYIKEHKLYV